MFKSQIRVGATLFLVMFGLTISFRAMAVDGVEYVYQYGGGNEQKYRFIHFPGDSENDYVEYAKSGDGQLLPILKGPIQAVTRNNYNLHPQPGTFGDIPLIESGTFSNYLILKQGNRLKIGNRFGEVLDLGVLEENPVRVEENWFEALTRVHTISITTQEGPIYNYLHDARGNFISLGNGEPLLHLKFDKYTVRAGHTLQEWAETLPTYPKPVVPTVDTQHSIQSSSSLEAPQAISEPTRTLPQQNSPPTIPAKSVPQTQHSTVQPTRPNLSDVPSAQHGQVGQLIKPSNDDENPWEDFGARVMAQSDIIPPDKDDAENIRSIRLALAKIKRNSVVLLGESGSGKTELVRTFVWELKHGAFPEFDPKTPIIRIDATFVAGDKYSGMIEAKVKKLLEYARKNHPIVFIDEIHSFIGQGVVEGNPNDVLERLKSAMGAGELRIIGTSTREEWDRAVAENPALKNRFADVDKKVLELDKLPERLNGWLNANHLPELNPELLKQIADLSERFDGLGAQPNKSIKLLEQVIGLAKLEAKPLNLIDEGFIKEAAMSLYHIDRSEFDSQAGVKRLEKFRESYKAKIANDSQTAALLERLERRAVGGTQDLDKPRIRVTFAGPGGTGKSERAKAYAESIGRPYVRINMSEYANGKTPEQFLRRIGEIVAKNPFTVVNFDETEKANIPIQNTLLELYESRFINSPVGKNSYEKVRVSDLSLFSTTNAGALYIASTPPDKINQEDLIAHMVRDGYSPFLLDRNQKIIPVYPPQNLAEFKEVLKLKLLQIIEGLESKNKKTIKLESADEFIDLLASKHFVPPTEAKISFASNNRRALEELNEAIRDGVAEVTIYSGSGDMANQPEDYFFDPESKSH